MLTRKPKAEPLATSEAPLARPLPQAFPGLSPADVNREVRCIGGGAYDGVWTVPAPLPQELSAGTVSYDLSDRDAGLYVWRHR
jgi:hypothetical protein